MSGHEIAYADYSAMLARSQRKENSLETYAQNVAGKTGFDPATIIAVIEAILTALGPILQNCGKPIPPAKEALAMGDSFVGTLAIYRGMRANDIRPLSPQGRKLHSALVEEGKVVSVEDAATLMALAAI